MHHEEAMRKIVRARAVRMVRINCTHVQCPTGNEATRKSVWTVFQSFELDKWSRIVVRSSFIPMHALFTTALEQVGIVVVAYQDMLSQPNQDAHHNYYIPAGVRKG